MQHVDNSSYTADYEQMAEFVDGLLAQKYPGTAIAPDAANTENNPHLAEREAAIARLSDYLDTAIVGKLSAEQKADLECFSEEHDDNPSALADFFRKNGIDFNAEIKSAMMDFATDFLGGANEK